MVTSTLPPNKAAQRFADAAVLDEDNFVGFDPRGIQHREPGEMSRCAEASDADPLAFKIADRSDLRFCPGIDGQNRQRRSDHDQVAAAEPAWEDRAAAGVTDGKFTGEYRRIDQRRAAHEYGRNLEAVFLKKLFFDSDKKRQRRARNRRVANR